MQETNYTATTHKVWLPGGDRFVHFTPRPLMKRTEYRPHRAGAVWPAPASLPNGYTTVDNAIVPIDLNDRLGICGPCMAAHTDNVLTLRATGAASQMADIAAFRQQYLRVSGGDNGTDELEMTGQVWGPPSGIAGIAPAGAVLDDHIDIPTDPAIVASAIANLGFVGMAFSVPNRWINTFNQAGGAVWDVPAVPNPMNGHFVALVGTDNQGRFILLTWGSYVYLTPAALMNCQAELFTGWSRRAYNPATGLDFAGRTYDERAAFYRSVGGTPPPNPFPVPGPGPGPEPTPGPTPTPPPTPGPTPIPGPGNNSTILIDWTSRSISSSNS